MCAGYTSIVRKAAVCAGKKRHFGSETGERRREMEAYVNQQREKWKTYGCTIMSDGWTGPTKLSIINFMVYSKGSTVFLKSVDASNYIKDHKYI